MERVDTGRGACYISPSGRQVCVRVFEELMENYQGVVECRTGF